jgi:hypothetical protein
MISYASAGCAAVVALLGLCSIGDADAQTGKPTTIHVVVDETHDRITPEGNFAIEKLHEGNFVLIGKTAREVWTNTNVGNGSTEHTHADPGAERNTALGEMKDAGLGQIVWHVLGGHKLQRIQSGKQLLQIWNIDIDDNRNCRLEVKYLLQKGFDFQIGYRAGTHELARFTAPKVVKASCTIE